MSNLLKTQALVAEYIMLEGQVAALVAAPMARLNEIQAELRSVAPHGKTAFDNIGHVTISDNFTYPEKDVLKDLSAGQVKRCQTMKYDSKKARANYPENFEAARVEGPLKVSVKKH